MTTPLTAQGPALHGMPTQQQGYAPGFPAPLGMEQYLGTPQQQYGSFPQYSAFPQTGFAQSQFGGQQVPIQQVIQSLVSQLLPIAQQVILPQVVATATQQISAQLAQIVAQQVNTQLAQQGGWSAGAQLPPFAQNNWGQPGRPYPGIF